ncbi:acyltransferase family protein [Actinomycetota bacterium Odt1-20B]
MRFIGAFLVFALHATQFPYIRGQTGDFLGDVFANSGYYGVTFFFLLSGFVLTWVARPGDRATSIWRRRVVKVFPNHLVTLGLTAVLMLIASDVFTLKATLANVFLVQSWFSDMETSRTMNTVSWSLSCELFFYLSFPALLRLVNRVPFRRLWALAAGIVALTWAAPLVGHFMINGPALGVPPYGSLSYEQIWFVYLFPPVRALEFVLGMVIARLVMAGAWPRLGLVPAGLIAVGGYVVSLQLPYLFGLGGGSVVWLVPLVAAGALADTRGDASPFRHRALVWLGERSFAFYMVHSVVLLYCYRWIAVHYEMAPVVGAGMVLALFVFCLALSHALYAWVEMPMVRRFSRPRKKNTVRAAPERVLASVKGDD